jgi:hypothetical protein
VRAGVVQVLALEIDLRAAALLGQALGVVHRAGTPDVVLQLVAELGFECRILARLFVSSAQLVERMRKRLGNEHSAVRPEVSPRIRQVIHLHF